MPTPTQFFGEEGFPCSFLARSAVAAFGDQYQTCKRSSGHMAAHNVFGRNWESSRCSFVEY